MECAALSYGSAIKKIMKLMSFLKKLSLLFLLSAIAMGLQLLLSKVTNIDDEVLFHLLAIGICYLYLKLRFVRSDFLDEKEYYCEELQNEKN